MIVVRSLVLAAVLVAAGCGGNATGSGLDVESGDGESGGPVTTRGTWTYFSTEVDVRIVLVTERRSDSCVTTATLTVDKATASPDAYDLDPTSCSVLALTETGDIVLYDSPTGHDWSPEPLRVDTDRELIELGPWTPPEPSAPSYHFTIAAPECGNDCSCPFLRRRAGSEDLILDLGISCE